MKTFLLRMLSVIDTLFRYVVYVILLVAISLTGCSCISYESETAKVSICEFCTDNTLTGFNYETLNAKVSIDSLEANQTNSLEALAEGITKGAIKGVKP